MDEVITCGCANQTWVIGVNGVRCSQCEHWLPLDAVTADVVELNAGMEARRDATMGSLSPRGSNPMNQSRTHP